MSSTLLARVKEVFGQVYELPAEEREAALEAACGDDAALRREVERLLGHHDLLGDEPELPPAPGPGALYQAGDRVGDRYRIVAFLGSGGMGEVYRADDLVLGETVALKFLRSPQPALLQALRTEVRLARQVRHPAVCRIHDIGELDGRAFLSMEFVEGQDLSALLRQLGHLPPPKALEVAGELCDGLAAAHECGVLHRDLKPSNVMLDEEGRGRIVDFGIAIQPEAGGGPIAGTPLYMAPELLAGGTASPQSDLYALCLVLYEALTGRHPLRGSVAGDVARPAEGGRPPPPSQLAAGVPDRLDRAILRGLSEDPRDRPASARALRAMLEGEETAEARSPSTLRAWLAPGLLLSVWVLCLALHVHGGVSGLRKPYTDLLVQGAARPDDHPVFLGFGRPPAQASSLQPGDLLIRAGDRDLRGVGSFWLARVLGPQIEEGRRLRLETLRNGVPGRAQLELQVFPSPWWLFVVPILSWVLIPTWLLLRAPRDPRVRALFYAGICPGIGLCFFGAGEPWREVAELARYQLFGNLLSVPMLLRLLCWLPDRRALSPRARWLWAFGPAFVLSDATALVLFAQPWAFRLYAVAYPLVVTAAAATGVALLVSRYRESAPIGRRQLRWVMFSSFLWLPALALAYVLRAFDPTLGWLPAAVYATTVVAPVGFVIAVSRYNLFDIDRLISATLGYGAVAAALLAGALVAVPRLVDPLAEQLGVGRLALQIPAALLLVLTGISFRGRIRRGIDRLLFRDRYEADAGIEELLAELPGAETAAEVYERTGARLQAVFRARSAAIYALDEAEGFAPVFAAEPDAVARVPAESPVVGLLARRRGALASMPSRGERTPDRADAFERAALQTLSADLVVPIRRRERLVGFFALGAKDSGDVYTSVDRALLAALARVVGEEVASRSEREAISPATTRASAASSARSTDV